MNFNGAMAVRPWMADNAVASAGRIAELQWGHGREAMDGGGASATIWRPTYFNGAMAVRPWMERALSELHYQVPELQWGHGREAMDGWLALYWSGLRAGLQWGHGREAMDGGFPTPALSTRPFTSMGPWP